MAEELHIELTQQQLGTTSDPDTMTTEFQIIVDQKNKLGEASKLMYGIIRKHLMENEVEIKKL